MTLKPMKCECCGGIIDRHTLICQMCGIAYKYDDYMQPIRITEYTTKVETLSCRVAVPDYIVKSMGEQEAMEMTLHQMAHQMAEKIMPLIEFTHEFDVQTMSVVTYGRIKVANPHTKTLGYKEVTL